MNLLKECSGVMCIYDVKAHYLNSYGIAFFSTQLHPGLNEYGTLFLFTTVPANMIFLSLYLLFLYVSSDVV